MHNFHACDFCRNAATDFYLDSDSDLSFSPVGESLDGYSMFIRSGDSRSTSLIVSYRGRDVSSYSMKFCPNCGRYLHENGFWRKGKKG